MTKISFKKADVDGFNVFYREAGLAGAPALLLLHGFPSSSHMFRDLIPLLAGTLYIAFVSMLFAVPTMHKRLADAAQARQRLKIAARQKLQIAH